MRGLEREIKPGPRQTKVVVRSGNNVPAEVGDDSAMRAHPHFESAANLRHALGFAVVEIAPDDSERLGRIEREVVSAATAENPAAARPDIGREAGTIDREAKGECSQRGTGDMTVVIAAADANDPVIESFVVIDRSNVP